MLVRLKSILLVTFFCLFGVTGYGSCGDQEYLATGYENKNSDEKFSQKGNLLKIKAGIVELIEKNGSIIGLNGEVLYESSKKCCFKTILKMRISDCVVVKEGNRYRYLKVGKKGKCYLSGVYDRSPANVSMNNGALLLKDKVVKFKFLKFIKPDNNGFWRFFTKFRTDEKFQNSRIVFPLKKILYSIDGKPSGEEYVSVENWSFVNFEKEDGFIWESPVVNRVTASVLMKGMGMELKFLFKKKSEKWMLILIELKR